MARDLTEAQFIKRLKANGFRPDFFGYWKMPPPCDNTSIHPPIALRKGSFPRREKLAWMLAEFDREIQRDKARKAKQSNQNTPSAIPPVAE